jgi:hypothetical protein
LTKQKDTQCPKANVDSCSSEGEDEDALLDDDFLEKNGFSGE